MGFFWKDLKNGYGSLIHPGDDSRKEISIGETLRTYYSVAVIPFILFLVVGSVWYWTYGASVYSCTPAITGVASGLSCGPHQYFSVFNNFIKGAVPITGVIGAVLLADVVFLLIVPVIGIFIDSLIYHVIGRSFLKEFKRPWNRTFTGVMYGALPMLALYWLLFIPVVSLIFLGILVVWGFINGIIAIANQQRITRLQSFGVYLVTLFIILLIVLVFGSVALGSLASAPVYGPVVP